MGIAEKFKKTISSFINSFRSWEKVRSQVLKATSILITKADPNTKIENIREIIVNLRDSVKGMGMKQR